MTERIKTVGQLKKLLNNYYNDVPVETRNRYDIGVTIHMDKNKVTKLVFEDSGEY